MVNKIVCNKLQKLLETKSKRNKSSPSSDKTKIKKTEKQRNVIKKLMTKNSAVGKALMDTAEEELGLNKSKLFQVPAFPQEDSIKKKNNKDVIIRQDIALLPVKKVKSTPLQSQPEKLSFYGQHQDQINKDNPPGLFFLSPCFEKDNMQQDDKKLSTDKDKWKISALKQYGWGDKWAHEAITCRCSKCEFKHIVTHATDCKMFIFVDMDNWGLGYMGNPVLTKSLSWIKNGINNTYLWCFHGAGYRDFLDQNGKTLFDKIVGDEWLEIQNSIFGLFKKRNHIRFSPTGYHKQSADLSILNVVKLLTTRVHIVVISKDKRLLSSAQKIHDKLGGGLSFLTINPDIIEKPFEEIGKLYAKLKFI
jgi:hypothetical protein